MNTPASSIPSAVNVTHEEPGSPPVKRAVQFVTTLAQRRQMAEWMIQEATRCATDKHIASKAVRQFPALFPGNAKANLMRASRIWKQRSQLIAHDLHLPAQSQSAPLQTVAARIRKQALPGRGRKRASWTDALQRDLLHEYHRLNNAGLVFSPKVIRAAADSLLRRGMGAEYSSNMIDPRSDKPLLECLTSRWVRAFVDRYQLPVGKGPGPGNYPESRRAKIEFQEKMIAYHLGKMSRLLSSGALREEDVETLSPIHFILNTENGKSLGFGESQPPHYSEIATGARAMTVFVRISGGAATVVEPPFVILQDAHYRYPLPNVPDTMHTISYRTSPTGWMDQHVLTLFLKEQHAIKPLPNGRRRVLFVEPTIWHACAADLEQPLRDLNTELSFFPQNCAASVQPVEMILRDKIKQFWVHRWEEIKGKLREVDVLWSADATESANGFVDASPRHFLKLAAMAVRDINNLRDDGGLPYPRKAMIESGMALNVNGRWELEQLSPELIAIVCKHREHFNGEMVVAESKHMHEAPTPRIQPRQPHAHAHAHAHALQLHAGQARLLQTAQAHPIDTQPQAAQQPA